MADDPLTRRGGVPVHRRSTDGSSSPAADRAPSLSRRHLLALGLGGAGLAAGAARLPAQGMDATPASGHGAHPGAEPSGVVGDPIPWEPGDLVEPEERRSVNGTLSTPLRVQYAYQDIGGYRLHLRTYEGTIPGPTFRVQPGDGLRLNLINDLPPNRDAAPVSGNLPHHFNTTNFHLHGSHASPSGISDNVLRSMEPGQRYPIEIDLPSTHTRGTYWYHPHRHGSSDVQITSGMAGVLIVDGDFADVPEIANATERVLVLNEVLFDYLGTIEDYDTVWPEAVPRFLTINGQREPIVRLRPGEVQRWRIVHAGHEDNLRLALSDHTLHSIAFDGIQSSRIGRDASIVIAPGQRLDVLVQAGAPGSYELRALPNDQGYQSPTGLLARVVVAGEPLAMGLPRSLPAPPLASIAAGELTGTRQITLSARDPENGAAANFQEFAFMVDGRLFDPDRVDQRVRLGAVEEWTVVNEHTSDHVFHIHTNPFQVTEVDGQPLAQPVWRDTVVVPRNGSLTFRSRFLDFTGKSVLHCHMLNHETLGMMQIVEIVD